jgi:phytanoyl-CoA hydroxylase
MAQGIQLAIDPAIPAVVPELGIRPDPDQIRTFRATGVGVVRGLIERHEVETILDVFMGAVADGPVPGVSEITSNHSLDRDDPLLRYPRMLHPHRSETEFGRLALKYLLDERIWNVLRNLIGEEPIAAQSMFYFKPPGARGQGLHQDNNPLAVRPGTCIAAWIALDETDEANGSLRVVPGSGPLELLCDADHENRSDLFFNQGSLRLPEGTQAVAAEMSPGDVLFFNGQTIHGSYPNTTSDRWRRTLIFHYAPERCEEVAGFYHPLLAADGSVVERAVSPEGGICGAFHRRTRM